MNYLCKLFWFSFNGNKALMIDRGKSCAKYYNKKIDKQVASKKLEKLEYVKFISVSFVRMNALPIFVDKDNWNFFTQFFSGQIWKKLKRRTNLKKIKTKPVKIFFCCINFVFVCLDENITITQTISLRAYQWNVSSILKLNQRVFLTLCKWNLKEFLLCN